MPLRGHRIHSSKGFHAIHARPNNFAVKITIYGERCWLRTFDSKEEAQHVQHYLVAIWLAASGHEFPKNSVPS
jgi:hypothetical protein